MSQVLQLNPGTATWRLKKLQPSCISGIDTGIFGIFVCGFHRSVGEPKHISFGALGVGKLKGTPKMAANRPDVLID